MNNEKEEPMTKPLALITKAEEILKKHDVKIYHQIWHPFYERWNDICFIKGSVYLHFEYGKYSIAFSPKETNLSIKGCKDLIDGLQKAVNVLEEFKNAGIPVKEE